MTFSNEFNMLCLLKSVLENVLVNLHQTKRDNLEANISQTDHTAMLHISNSHGGYTNG